MPSIKPTVLPKTEEVAFRVVEKLHADPFPGQRSHRLHLNEAKYLHTRKALHGDQLIFHAARYRHPETNRWVTQLIDGYTRVEAVSLQMMVRPKTVLLVTHTRETYEQARDIYLQHNSPSAAKRGKHHVQSGVREATSKLGDPRDTFQSQLLLNGPSTSGIMYSGIPGATVHAKTSNGFAALDTLDSMGLRKNVETAPLMAAYIAIVARDAGTKREVVAKSFIEKMNHFGTFEPRDLEDEAVLEARAFHTDRRTKKTTSGTKNVFVVRDRVLAYYQYYLDMATEGPTAVERHNLTLGQFRLAA